VLSLARRNHRCFKSADCWSKVGYIAVARVWTQLKPSWSDVTGTLHPTCC